MHDWLSWIMNGLPMLLLLGIWLFFMRRIKTRDYAKLWSKQIELLEAQVATLRQTNELLKALAHGI